MQVRDISFTHPTDNLLFDEVLLKRAESGWGGECLRFWESPVYFTVLGKICKPEQDLHVDRIQADGLPVLRRCSGGGTVLQGPGCFNYSLILAKERDAAIADLKQSYQWILSRVVAALAGGGIAADFFPISDIAMMPSRLKCSGNAQKRGRRFILHHGTILYDFDLNLIERYLRFPESTPDYRQGRGHLQFVGNVPVTSGALKEGLQKQFEAIVSVPLAVDEEHDLRALGSERDLSVIVC